LADILLFLVGLTGCGFVVVSLGVAYLGSRGLRPLRDIPLDEIPLPKLSVLVPACNEAAEIESCLRSLTAQDYPDLEVVAINDRSTDDTGKIMTGREPHQSPPALNFSISNIGRSKGFRKSRRNGSVS